MSKELDYLLKGETFLQYFRKDSNAEARRMYLEATKSASNEIKARGHAYLSYALLQAYLYNWYDGDPADAVSEMLGNAQLAVTNNGADYQNHWLQAAALLYSKNFPAAKLAYPAVEKMMGQAIPEDEWAFQVDYADMLLLTGDVGLALTKVTSTIAACTIPERWFYWVLGWAYYMNKQYDNSLDAFKNFRFPRNAIRKNVIANLVALKRIDEARNEAFTFLYEEKDQGILYAQPGKPVLPGLLLIEDRVPIEDPNRKQVWIDDLTPAFEFLNQP